MPTAKEHFELHASQTPPATRSEEHTRENALGIERAWRHMCGVVQIRAFVECLDVRRAGRAARVTDLMHRGRCRHVTNLVAACAETTAEIGVLPVQEIARVEAADFVEGRTAHEH